jgi:hypothetical protein
MKSAFIPAIVVLSVAGPASAVICYGPAVGGSIPDFAGGVPGSVSSMLTIGAGEAIDIGRVEVAILGLTHTWAGDLAFTLSRGATSVTFVNRPGVPASTFGDSTNYGADYTFGDDNGLILNLETALAGLGDTAVLPTGTYFDPGGASLAPFVGTSAAGDWTLTISDHAGGDTGMFLGWGLCITEIPAPSTLGLLGFAALVAARRRR